MSNSKGLGWIPFLCLLLASLLTNRSGAAIVLTPGVQGTYYSGEEFGSAILTRTDPYIDFDWGRSSPGPGVPSEHFSVRWIGTITAPASGTYTFSVTVDDGIRLYINNQLLINSWQSNGGVLYQATIPLEANSLNSLVLEYKDLTLEAEVHFGWSLSGVVSGIVSAPYLNISQPAPDPFPVVEPSPSRSNHSACYLGPGIGGVLFGGDSTPDTWIWKNETHAWNLAAPAIHPSPRSGHRMCEDSQGNALLVGGQAIQAETWKFTGTTSQWENKGTVGLPAQLWNHAMAYDPVHNQSIIFGGNDGAGKTNETYVWNAALSRWDHPNPAARPSARESHAIGFDPKSQKIILFGGDTGASLPNDIWGWTGSNWELLNNGIGADSPVGRRGHLMLSDPILGRVVVEGGRLPDGSVATQGLVLETTKFLSSYEEKIVAHPDFSGGGFIREISADPVTLGPVFSADGAMLCTAGSNAIRLWRVSDGGQIRNIPTAPGIPSSIAFSLDGQEVAAGFEDGSIKFWRISDGSLARTLALSLSPIRHLTFLPDGDSFIAATLNVTPNTFIGLWNFLTGGLLRSIATTATLANIRDLEASRDGTLVAAAFYGGGTYVWGLDDGALRKTFTEDFYPNAVSFSPTGSSVFVAADISQRSLTQYFMSGSPSKHYYGHTSVANDVAISSDGSIVASVSNDRTVRIWRTADQALLNTLTGHVSLPNRVAFSQSGLLLASLSTTDGKLRLWGQDFLDSELAGFSYDAGPWNIAQGQGSFVQFHAALSPLLSLGTLRQGVPGVSPVTVNGTSTLPLRQALLSPEAVGTSQNAAGYLDAHESQSVTISGHRYLATADGTDGLKVAEVTEPYAPGAPVRRTLSGDANAVKVWPESPLGPVAFVGMPAAVGQPSIQAVKNLNANPPVTAGILNAPRQLDPRTLILRVIGGQMHAILANGIYGLQIARVSDPTAMAFRGGRTTTDSYNDVDVSDDGRYAFIAANLAGLVVVDLLNPDANPLPIVGSVTVGPTPQSPLDAQAVNYMKVADRAYALVVTGVGELGGGGDLVIVEVTNPAAPKVRKRLNLPAGDHADARGASIFRKAALAAISQSSGGLTWVAVGHPINPQIITRYEPPEGAVYTRATFETDGGAPVFISAGRGGLVISESFHDLGTPTFVSGQQANMTIPGDLRHGFYNLTGISAYGDLAQTSRAFAVNRPPSSIPSLILPPNPAYTSDDLNAIASGATDADGDPVQYRFNWYKNGVLQPNLSGIGRDTLAAANTARGQVWSVDVSAFDGIDDGPVATRTRTIQNSPPTAPSLAIVPQGQYGNSADSFGARKDLTNLASPIGGSNVGASKESGEPNHAGFAGGHSVWYLWKGPATGPADISTAGSDFDTLLAVYALNESGLITGLAPVAANDNADGSTTASHVTFNATEGAVYQIAIDGKNGSSGNLVLTWSPSQGPNAAPEAMPATNDMLYGYVSNPSADADPEDATLVYKYRWIEKMPGGSESELSSGELTNLSVPGIGSRLAASLDPALTVKHRTYRFEVHAEDLLALAGPVVTTQKTIRNSVPTGTATLAISSNPPGFSSSADFTAIANPTSWSDADADAVIIDGGCEWQDKAPAASIYSVLLFEGEPYRDQTLNGVRGLVSRDDQLQVRAFGFDGEDFSASATNLSAFVTLSNGAPFPPEFALAPATPVTTDALTGVVTKPGFDPDRGDTVTTTWQWLKADPGSLDFTAIGSPVTGAVPPSIDPSQTLKHQRWQLAAFAREDQPSSLVSQTRRVTVEIANSPPSSAALVLSPAQTSGSPVTGDIIIAQPSGYTDADPDDSAAHYQVRWRRYQPGSSTPEDLPAYTRAAAPFTLPASETSSGQRIEAIVRAFNDEGASGIIYGPETASSVIIRNTLPQPPTAVSLAPAEGFSQPRTTDNLVLTPVGGTDADDGPISSYYAEWIEGNGDQPTPGQNALTLSASVTGKGQRWRARIYSIDLDGAHSAGFVESAAVTIKNTPPSAPAVTLFPLDPHRSTGVTAMPTSTDADPEDNQPGVLIYEFHWYKNGSAVAEPDLTSGAIPPGRLTRGDHWEVRCAARDGSNALGPETAGIFFDVSNSPPTAPVFSISPPNPNTNDSLTPSVTAAAIDADPGDTFTVTWQWQVAQPGSSQFSDFGGPSLGTPPAPVASAQTTKHQQWRLRVDLQDNYTPPATTSVTQTVGVANSLPAAVQITALPAQTESAPSTTDDLSVQVTSVWDDADSEDLPAYEFRWRRYPAGSGQGEDVLVVVNGTGLSILASDQTLKGERYEVRVRPVNDDGVQGIIYGPETSAELLIRNSRPLSPQSIQLQPPQALASRSLILTPVAASDPDLDPLHYRVEWSRRAIGATQFELVPNETGVTLPAGITIEGETWRARLFAVDDENLESSQGTETGDVPIVLNNSSLIAHNLPLQVAAGNVVPIQITMRNAGSSTWKPLEAYALAVYDDPCALTSANRLGMESGVIVPPGTSYLFSGTFTAPLSPGSCRLDFAMVQELVEFFGGLVSASFEIVPALNDAQFVDSTIPPTFPLGKTLGIGITVRNKGNTFWSSDDRYALAVLEDPCSLFGGQSAIPVSPGTFVGSNENYQFVVFVTAPGTGQDCAVTLKMVQLSQEDSLQRKTISPQGSDALFGPPILLNFHVAQPPNAIGNWSLYE